MDDVAVPAQNALKMVKAVFTWKHVLHWLGTMLALGGVVFVGDRLHAYGNQIEFARLDQKVWMAIAISSVVYALDNTMLAVAWRGLLEKSSERVRIFWAVRVYGISQLAKYVPGNVFHFAGRQAMGMAAGLPGRGLAKSAVLELVLLALASFPYVGLVLPLLHGWPLWRGIGAFAVIAGVLAWLVGKGLGWPRARAWMLYLLFLGISGGIFVLILTVVAPDRPIGAAHWLELSGAYVMAWFAGMVTPGAPAGVGVRELILLFLLHGRFDQADLLLAVILGRVVTVAGDAMFFFASLLIPARESPH